jgi:hypothetical protein
LTHSEYDLKRPLLESEVQKLITDYLDLKRVYWARINVGGLVRKGTWTKSGATKGVSDLVIIYLGTVIWCEVKRLGKKQNADQVKFEQNVKANGGTYLLAYSVNDVRACLEGLR